MPRAMVIGVMGAGSQAHQEDLANAGAVGEFVANQGWVLLTGGRNAGVMAAASEAAARNHGLTIGILPGESRSGASPHLALALPTGLGNARNAVNVLASDVVVVCGQRMGAGTLSEMALAVKCGKPLIVITDCSEVLAFLKRFEHRSLRVVPSAELARQHLVEEVEKITAGEGFLPLSTSHP